MNNLSKKIGALLSLFIWVFCITGITQAQNIQTRTGFGYYNPKIGGSTGNIFYTDISFKLPTEYYVGAGFGFSDVFTKYGEEVPLFEGFRSIRNYYHFRLMIHREFVFGRKGNHVVKAGPGITYIQLRYAEPFVYLYQPENELVIGIDESDRKQDDAGMLFSVDYGYKVNEKIEIGVHTEAHILLNIGLGGIVLAPQISFSF